MKRTKVVCVGEALIDRIKNKTNEDFTDFLGGAPANVACGLKKLRIDSVFIGSIGDDEHGKKFVNYFKKLDVNINYSGFCYWSDRSVTDVEYIIMSDSTKKSY